MNIKRNINLQESPRIGQKVKAVSSDIKNKNTYIPTFEEIPILTLSRQDKIETLGLPMRIENALKNVGIQNVGEFYDTPETDFIHFRNLGTKSFYYLSQVRKKIILSESYKDQFKNFVQNEGLIRSKYLVKKNPEKLRLISTELMRRELFEKKKQIEESKVSSNNLIFSLLDRCKDARMKIIIQRRFGLLDGERETLEEIGILLGITRERVRQIEFSALKKLRHPSVSEKKVILEEVEEIMWENGGVISEEEADRLIKKKFKGVLYDGSSILDLFFVLGWIDKNDLGSIKFYSPKFKRVTLARIMNDIIDILRKTGDLLSIEEISKLLGYFNPIERESFLALIHKCCKLDPRIEEKVEGKFSVHLQGRSTSKSWVHLMTKTLEEEGAPLHFTDIVNKVNNSLVLNSQQLDYRRAHGLLIENPEFAHTGIRGTYGLTKWGFAKESTLDLVYDFISKAGFPVHWEQIYSYVSKYKNSKKQNIKSILDGSGKFTKKSNGFYWIDKKYKTS